MTTKTSQLTQTYLKPQMPDVRPGDTVRAHVRITEGVKERIQVFEGVVLAQKHGKGIEGTMTVRKISQGVGVERIFPLHSPLIEKIEVVKRTKVRRAKLYYLRDAKGKRGRLKATDLDVAMITNEQPSLEQEVEEEVTEEPVTEEVVSDDTAIESQGDKK